jgi:Na+/proline symporter
MLATLDWLVLIGVLALIVFYGVWKTRGSKNIHGFLLGGNEAKWWTIGLSVMATQASAITFLSTPGQGYDDGMRFVQFYFGLPLAMIVICIFFIPMYYRLKVYTAYEYLERRFDLKTRILTSGLFLVQRGLGAGLTIFAPSLILSSLLGWSLTITNLVIGTLVIIYTVSGGTKAVSLTQKHQMGIILIGMTIIFFLLLSYLPHDVSFKDALTLAGSSNKLNVLDFSFDWDNRYTFWSGITGGFFLAMAYFGTDQSQVQRYLGGRSIRESRLGLIFNSIFKVPLQFFILLIGVMVFVFYQFNSAPIFFNETAIEKIKTENSNFTTSIDGFEEEMAQIHSQRQGLQNEFFEANDSGDEVKKKQIGQELILLQSGEKKLRSEVKEFITAVSPETETNDTDYVFLHFILNHLPKGLIGLLLAVILSAAMSSTSAELNALASTTTIDIYKRNFRIAGSESHYLNASRLFTLMWGLVAICFSMLADLAENLIQFVNIIGSIFYGPILGVFLTAFILKFVKGHAIFIGALIAQGMILYLYFQTDIAYLWFNVIGPVIVMICSVLVQLAWIKRK